MRPVSIRLIFILSALAVFGWPAVARANHHHIGGSGSGGGDDPNADCLAWGYVIVDGGATDAAAAADAGSDVDAAPPTDAGTGDGGSAPPPGAVLVCLEHATLFGCDCSAGAAGSKGWSPLALTVAGAIVLAARRRRRASHGGGDE